MNDELCHCGKPLHYTTRATERFMGAMVNKMGRFITVSINGRSWKVDRHYIALHGIKGDEMDTYGFEEITNSSEE